MKAIDNKHNITTSWAVSFFTFWSGQAVSLVGSSISQFALIWWLTKSTGSATVLATATLVSILPRIFIYPIAGALVDRWNRRWVMIFADCLTAIASAWLAYLFYCGNIKVGHVYIIMFLRTVGESFHFPAMISTTTLMVPDRQLTRVAGLNETLRGILTMVAPPLGALFLEISSFSWIMLFDLFTAIPAILTLLFIQIPQPTALGERLSGLLSLFADVYAGLRYVWHQKGLFAIYSISAIMTLMIRPAFALLPILVTQHFGGQVFALAGFESALGFGVIAGGGILSVWGGFKRRVITIMSGIIGMGVGLFLTSIVPSTFMSFGIAALFVCGFMFPIIDGPTVALIQSTVQPGMQGRVFSLLISISDIFSPISMIIAGPVAEYFGIRLWYLIGGITCVIMGSVGLIIPAILTLESTLYNNLNNIKTAIGAK